MRLGEVLNNIVRRFCAGLSGAVGRCLLATNQSPRGPGGLLLLVLVFLLAVAGCSSRQNPGSHTRVPVTVAEATLGQLSRGNLLTGKVMAKEEVNLSPKIPGKVGRVQVDVGQEVKAGQVVLTLDAPEIEAAVRQAEAAAKVAEAGVVQAELGMEKAKAALEQAQESYRLAEANYKRGKLLLDEEAVSQADFEARFEQPYINAVGALKTAEASYNQAVDQKEHVAPAQLNQARAALAAAQTNAANTVLTAPISGIVSARNVDPGELIAAAVPALTVVNIDEVVMECGATETQVNELKVGQDVKVFVSAVRSEPFVGHISNISPSADPRTKTYTVKVKVPNTNHLIKPGMFAEADLGVAKKVVLVPRDAVVTRDNTTVVFTVHGGKAVLRKVETGESDGRNIVIKEGLAPGERVVVSGLERITNGTKLTVVE